MAAAAEPVPPAPMTPTKANCEPPVNISRLSTLVCSTLSPAATDSAPSDTPYALVAIPTDSAWRQTAARAGSRRLTPAGPRPRPPPPPPPAPAARAGPVTPRSSRW